MEDRYQDYEKDYYLACELALATGRVLRDFARSELAIEHKGDINIVTAADTAAETYLRGRLECERPHDAIMGEEQGVSGSGERTWVIDPLDGTTNFAHEYPAWCVSIALVVENTPMVGVVYDATRDELWSAWREHGAHLGRRHLHVSEVSILDKAFLATGFPYDLRTRPEQVLAPFNALVRKTLGIRRPGSAALDLCYLATGRFDGFWEYGLYPWDTAAGTLMVTEAGGRISGIDGGKWDINAPFIAASNGLIHDEMLTVITAASGGNKP